MKNCKFWRKYIHSKNIIIYLFTKNNIHSRNVYSFKELYLFQGNYNHSKNFPTLYEMLDLLIFSSVTNMKKIQILTSWANMPFIIFALSAHFNLLLSIYHTSKHEQI